MAMHSTVRHGPLATHRPVFEVWVSLEAGERDAGVST